MSRTLRSSPASFQTERISPAKNPPVRHWCRHEECEASRAFPEHDGPLRALHPSIPPSLYPSIPLSLYPSITLLLLLLLPLLLLLLSLTPSLPPFRGAEKRTLRPGLGEDLLRHLTSEPGRQQNGIGCLTGPLSVGEAELVRTERVKESPSSLRRAEQQLEREREKHKKQNAHPF